MHAILPHGGEFLIDTPVSLAVRKVTAYTDLARPPAGFRACLIAASEIHAESTE